MNDELSFDECDEEFIQSQRNLWNLFEKSRKNDQPQPSSSTTTTKSLSKYQVSAPHDESIMETMDEYDIAMMLQDKALIDEQQRIFQEMMKGEPFPRVQKESQKISHPVVLKKDVPFGTTSTDPMQPTSSQSPCSKSCNVMTSAIGSSIESRIQNHIQDERIVWPQDLPTTMDFQRTPRHSQRSTTFVEPRERMARLSANSRQSDKDTTTKNHSSLGAMALDSRHQPLQHHYRTTTHDLAASYHAKDRVIQMGKYKLTVKGTSHVYNSIWQGSATIVQCSFCQAILQVGTTTKLIFCPNCQEVTPMEVARNVSTSPFHGGGGQQVVVADQDVAEVVQWQEDTVARVRKGCCSSSNCSS